MATLIPYLTFNGNCEEAFNFYRSVFGGEFISINRIKDIPESGGMPSGDQEKMMHISLATGNGNVLMAADSFESMGQKYLVGNNASISIHTENKEEADRIYSQLSAGGSIEIELQDVFWGSYFGKFVDKFGIQWLVNFDYKKPQ